MWDTEGDLFQNVKLILIPIIMISVFEFSKYDNVEYEGKYDPQYISIESVKEVCKSTTEYLIVRSKDYLAKNVTSYNVSIFGRTPSKDFLKSYPNEHQEKFLQDLDVY